MPDSDSGGASSSLAGAARQQYGNVAQLVERPVEAREVAGSNPAVTANLP